MNRRGGGAPFHEPTPGNIDIGFSDDRFLKHVLQAAAKSGASGSGDAAAQRLEAHGFGSEAARVALHVTGGDERKAMELCMSGLTFVGSGSGGGCGSFMEPETIGSRAPVAPLRCYICGGKHLTEKSLEIHLKTCRKRFEQREAKRPPQQRRPLLDESDLPDNVECLERHYELVAQNEIAPPTPPPRAPREILALLPCQFCKRTFTPDRLPTHQKVCLQKPKIDPCGPMRKSSTCTTPTAAAPPPPAAVRAYGSFCDRLAKCPGCMRQFRPELLQNHIKQCCPDGPKKAAPARKSWSGSGVSPSGYGAGRGGARGIPQPHRTAPGCDDPSTPSSSSRRARSANGSSPSTGGGRLAFSPPSRFGLQGSPAMSTGSPPSGGRRSTGGTATATPLSQLASEAALQNSDALVAKGLLTPVSPEDEGDIWSSVVDRLPNATLIGLFKVTVDSHNVVYNALKNSMQEDRGEDAVILEKDLWHGTSWAIVPKIVRQGFNRSFAGRHGTLLGAGTYFSTDPAYSQRFCDRNGGGRDGTKALMLSRVLVGNFCKGTKQDMEPPVMDTDTGDLFDSTVDSEEDPSIFVVFRDFQAVPLFLVEFQS